MRALASLRVSKGAAGIGGALVRMGSAAPRPTIDGREEDGRLLSIRNEARAGIGYEKVLIYE